LTGSNQLLCAETVTMQKLPTEEPGHRLQSNVRVRRDINRTIRGKRQGSHVIGEAPRSYGSPTSSRQCAAYGERSNGGFAALGDDDLVNKHCSSLVRGAKLVTFNF
jgi:hypothetical protein